MGSQKHLYSLDTLFRMAYDLKKQGRRIGITHGAFDLFHVSHLDLLQKSSKLCDFLIVGVDCNRNISQYKSNHRPIIKQSDRLKIVNELSCVDAVFINNLQLKPSAFTKLYRELKIDVVTIGQHFGFESVVYEQASRADAQLIKINTRQYPTTTSIINKIVNVYSGEV
ncbi:adenylyltransferase/cytidyltransferase family protein [Candidatus Shapirobacteria bacterium]|nr:adenylyltransferase/cytidyltransferase family protein [Candidatus Shapirobacteria bacterium]